MTHIKKLVLQGFKSFAKKTEIPFDKGINVVVGPNGSGKSNISDALCFVLGRLSIKSIRAAKAKNLLFMGSSIAKPSKEASVEIVFDNTNRTFNLEKEEISLKRIVRHNGQSIYKINNETKTRGEIIEMLAHAGIDPHGFNIVLQGQIQAIVKTHPEERRKIIEEVAGIAIYESRKEKSLKELEKSEVRLKEVSTILRERTAFLRNLEKERAQALKHKELENTIRRCKASILNRKVEDKRKELVNIKKSIELKTGQKDKVKQKVDNLQKQIEDLNQSINKINTHIQKSTGLEQETLHENIANLKAELEGLKVRRENYENKKIEVETRTKQLQTSIPEYESEIEELRKESPQIAKKQEELKKKKEELKILENEKKKAYTLKTELSALKERLKDKESQLIKIGTESDSLLKQIEEYSSELKYQNSTSCQESINSLKIELSESKQSLESISQKEIEHTKNISKAETEKASAEEVIENVLKIDTCPLCQNKMTQSHQTHVKDKSNKKIKESERLIKQSQKELQKLSKQKQELQSRIQEIEKTIQELEKELSQHSLIKDKQKYLKKLIEQEKILKTEVLELTTKRDRLEKKTIDSTNIEEQYNTKIREIEEISSRTEKDLDTTLLYKERELERMREVITTSTKNLEEIDLEISDLSESIKTKNTLLEKKESEEQALNEKFKKMFKERDSLQETIQQQSYNLSTLQSETRQIEDQVNYLKIGNAKLDAEREALEMEMQEFLGVELIKASPHILEEKLQKSQQTIQTLGALNMRALEIYDGIKEEYDKVKEKVETLEKEKEEILKIIDEIDRKKKRTFMKTFKGINELFSRNFSQLYTKGTAYLEIANKENIFEGGINIVIRLAKGKYFDVTSLSGGEQTLIALSLLFAIQEYKPYHFYIFDEIDAALDKRNSERLSALLKKYIREGQYLIVTHNDAIILDSNVLYGVSMHDGISKVLSLKLD